MPVSVQHGTHKGTLLRADISAVKAAMPQVLHLEGARDEQAELFHLEP
jgi:hypothetical protein